MKEITLNTHVGNDNQHMTSLEIAELTGKQHKDVLKAIRNMEPAWVKVNGRKFALVEYRDQKGELRPCYQLTKALSTVSMIPVMQTAAPNSLI